MKAQEFFWMGKRSRKGRKQQKEKKSKKKNQLKREERINDIWFGMDL